MPWADLTAAIEPFYPKAEGPRASTGGRRAHATQALRHFVGIDLGREPVPDETTICKFRHLLEAHRLGDDLFARIREYFAAQGLQVSRGTIVDATIIAAPSSTNRQKERDPEMHQTKKGTSGISA